MFLYMISDKYLLLMKNICFYYLLKIEILYIYRIEFINIISSIIFI